MKRRHDLSSDLDYQDESEAPKPKISIYQVPFYVGLLFMVYFGLLFSVAWYFENRLPTPLTTKDEIDKPEAFISERAIHDLKLLTDLGPKVTGSYENDVLAVDYILRHVDMILHQKNPNQQIEIDVQVVSGSYNLEMMSVDQINVYYKVQNVIVKLVGSQNETANSILVNSHFDSVPTSPGGSDDGINVVTMLEILRKLSMSPTRPLHNIIFLFNGAEETPLQASHGFITKHKWAKECKVLVNLEACGAGGRIILFQTGPDTPWLMKYYNMVPHPYGQAAGEEIFQSGLIPSDTDFRIFRDYGKLVGYDFAFYQDGYRYHTKYDDFKNIPHGSYQHVGDNILSLVKNLANAPEVSQSTSEQGKMIYYDVLGLFMVSYGTTTATIINMVSVLLSLGGLFFAINNFNLGYSKTSLKYYALTFGAVLGGWIITAVIISIIALILDLFNKTMSWYGNPWLIIGLYMLPSVACSGSLLHFVSNKNLSLNVTSQINVHIVRIIWTIAVLVGTLFGIRSVYAFVPLILLNSLAFLLIYLFKLEHTRRTWQLIHFSSLAIPTIILFYQMLITLKMFIPLLGRMGSNRNPDLFIGFISMFFTLLISSLYVSMVTLIRNVRYVMICIGVTFVIFFVIVFTPLGFPYRGDEANPAPQRYWLMHTKRIFHNEEGKIKKTDSGIFLLNMDRNSPEILKPFVKEIAKARSIQKDCEEYILCGLPLSHRLMTKIANYSTWVPASQPVIHEPLKFKLNSKEVLNSTLIRYNVSLSGPDRVGAFVVPKPGMSLVDLNILNVESQPHDHDIEKKLYFIRATSGKEPADLIFTFDIGVPPNHNGTTVDLAATAHYVHRKKFVKTPFYENFLKQFPDWADVTPWLGAYYAYIL